MNTALLKDLGENALLEHFQRTIPAGGSLRVGPGDDCAVVTTVDTASDLLLKTDAMVEGRHYTKGENPVNIGHKALARVLSDVAAMGGHPCHLLVTLALPAHTPVLWVEGFYRGINALAEQHGCRVAGGELSGLPDGAPAVISIAATGMVAAGRAVLRSGGKPGDILAVTGLLGGAFSSGHHLAFVPRLEEGQWLANSGAVTAMMDLSDGLARDLPRLAKASGCHYAIDPGALPMRPGCSPRQALGDGEDYELLLAVRPEAWPDLAARWTVRFASVPLTAIGRLLPPGEPNSPAMDGGWDHFRET